MSASGGAGGAADSGLLASVRHITDPAGGAVIGKIYKLIFNDVYSGYTNFTGVLWKLDKSEVGLDDKEFPRNRVVSIREITELDNKIKSSVVESLILHRVSIKDVIKNTDMTYQDLIDVCNIQIAKERGDKNRGFIIDKYEHFIRRVEEEIEDDKTTATQSVGGRRRALRKKSHRKSNKKSNKGSNKRSNQNRQTRRY
jgi:hypothetical protein